MSKDGFMHGFWTLCVKPHRKNTAVYGFCTAGYLTHGAVRFFWECHGAVRCGLTVVTKVTVFHGAVYRLMELSRCGAVFSRCHGAVRYGLTVVTEVTVFHGAVFSLWKMSRCGAVKP